MSTRKADAEIKLLWLSDFRYDHVCIFKITGAGVASFYLRHLSDVEANLPEPELLRFLLRNLQSQSTQLLDVV